MRHYSATCNIGVFIITFVVATAMLAAFAPNMGAATVKKRLFAGKDRRITVTLTLLIEIL